MKQILVIGGAGYIGSRLRQVLSPLYAVDSVDCCWFNYDKTSRRIDYHKLKSSDLEKYDTVILLAGNSSVASCIGPIESPWLNNVTNFHNLLTKLNASQQLIYASSASVYGNSQPGQRHTEKIQQFLPVNNYDITKYTLDLHAQIAIGQGRKVTGLRFGTVNGWSPNLRVDVMINAMYWTAVNYGKINVTNSHINRALLGIEDLSRAVIRCIEQPCPGIYNLASFNTTVGEIAQTVGAKLDVPVADHGVKPGGYDFGLDTELFEQTFNFTFTETPATIIDSLAARFEECHVERRDNYMIYNWEKEHELRERKRA